MATMKRIRLARLRKGDDYMNISLKEYPKTGLFSCSFESNLTGWNGAEFGYDDARKAMDRYKKEVEKFKDDGWE